MLDSAGAGAVVPFFVTRHNYIQKLHSEWIRGRSWPQALCIVNGITCGIITIEINWISHFNDILIYLDISWYILIYLECTFELTYLLTWLASHISCCLVLFDLSVSQNFQQRRQHDWLRILRPTTKSSGGLEWSCRVSFPAGCWSQRSQLLANDDLDDSDDQHDSTIE